MPKTQQGDGFYDQIANKVFGANLSEGEVHAPQYTSKGWRFGHFIGPGTNVYENIRNGKMPITETDRVAKAHDLRYGLARTNEAVRAADLKMISKLKELNKDGKDYQINIKIGQLPIQAKMLAEDIGIWPKGSFSSKKGVAPENQQLAEDSLKALELQGYGKRKPNAWTPHLAATRAKNKTMPYKDVMKLASKSYNSVM